MGLRELWGAFPSWSRGAGKSHTTRGFVCCAWNSACVASDELLKDNTQQVMVYKSPWSLQYQLPLLTLEKMDNSDAGSDDNTGMERLGTESKAILEAQKNGAFCETVNYGTQDAFSINLQNLLNNALWEYCLTYLLLCSNGEDESNDGATSTCRWGSSAFVRNLTSTEDPHAGLVTLEVVAIMCANDPEERTQIGTSLFDADELDSSVGNDDDDELCPFTTDTFSSSTRVVALARRRWTAGHLFQLRLTPTELLLRHDSGHLVVNNNFNSQDKRGKAGAHNYEQVRLFPRHQGRLESLPLPRCMRQNSSSDSAIPKGEKSVDVFFQCIDWSAVVGILCERIERGDNAVAIHGIVPAVRVTLPFMAPVPRQLWEEVLRRKSALVAAAVAEVAVKVKSRSRMT